MAKGLDVQHFFRRAPREWLERYFDSKSLMRDVQWAMLSKRKFDPLMRAWTALDADTRSKLADDFRNIQLLATPSGKLQIIDEAPYHHMHGDVAAKMLELGDYYACAFWVLLERPVLWDGALRYAIADGKSKTYWRKRINLPKLGRQPTEADAPALAAKLSEYFTKRQGRGGSCVVHPYRRGVDGNREYYFAYPEDHKHTPLVFDAGELVARPHNPAFEVIFIHDDSQQTLSIWHDGTKEQVRDLQVIFADAVLGTRISRDSPRDDRAYDLAPFLNPDFMFKPDDVLGIEQVELRKIRVRTSGKDARTLTIELGKTTAASALHRDLSAVLDGVPASQRQATQVGLQVTFEPLPNQTARRTRSFQITAPNSSNLKVDDFSPLIERMLVDHGIEPRAPKRPNNESD